MTTDSPFGTNTEKLVSLEQEKHSELEQKRRGAWKRLHQQIGAIVSPDMAEINQAFDHLENLK